MRPSATDTPSDPDSSGRPGRRGRGRRVLGGGRLDFAPRPIRFVESRPVAELGMFRTKRRVEVGAILAGVFALGTLALIAVLVYRGTRVDVDVEGLDDGDAVNGFQAAAMEVTIDVGSADKAESSTLSFDGEPVEEPDVSGNTIAWQAGGALEEGDHVLELRVPRPLVGSATFRWDFVVDSEPPELEVPAAVDPVALDERAALSGRVERGVTLTADGQEVEVDDDGAFRLEFSRAPAGPIAFAAVDRAGNTTTKGVVVPVTYPGLRAVHVSGPSWESEQLRGQVLRMLDEGRIDAIAFDLKDEGGVVGYDSSVRRARQIGAVTPYVNLADLVATVEDHGGRVVGRIAAFRDPILARAAWGSGERDQVIQTPDGRPFEEPGEFTNFADPAVRQYNLDIALEAVERGVDDIIWDDVRRPSGAPSSMAIPDLQGSSADALVGFLAEAHAQLRRRGVYQGVTTVGVAVDQGDMVGQDVRRMARNADYLAPQIYPGYWSAGQYDVASPVRQPGDLVRRVVGTYVQAVDGSGAVLAPWLQDFGVGGVGYGDAEVRAQVEGARAAGADRFLLWDPSVSYGAGGLDPR